MVGRTVAQYVILDRLGGGGMGEIYRAKDTRLNRTVAIKVLPAQDSLDEQRRQRFIQEAQAAASTTPTSSPFTTSSRTKAWICS
jgi:serine/threonine-protein kinase